MEQGEQSTPATQPRAKKQASFPENQQLHCHQPDFNKPAAAPLSVSTDTTIDAESLALKLRQRDRHAFQVIYDRYSAALYGVVMRIVPIEELAEDVLQETFVKIWKNTESYDNSRGTLFTWMLNIARNSALDKLRSSEYRQRTTNRSIENLVGEIDRQQNSSFNPETIGLQEFVLKLKPDQQQLIDLIYYQGFTQSEAADELGIPLGTVKTRVRSALIRLRELMNAETEQTKQALTERSR